MSEWHEVSLGSLTEWTSGGTPRKNEPNYWDGVIPWISANSMKKSRLEDSELKITPLGLENGSRLAGKGSILLLVRGSELHNRIPIGIAMKPLAFNQDVKALKAHDVLLPEYLLYWLLGNEKLILTKVEHTGIGAGKLDTNVMKNLRIHLPPLPDQHKIVGILSKLDDKIELNRQMNETLEAIARAIFKSWFVDFDPVRAKAEGRDTGLPEEIAELFPDSFEETELGEVPRGWGIGTVDQEFNLTMGQSPPGETYNEIKEGIPFYQGKTDFGFRFPSQRMYCTAPTRFAEAGDTLISVRAPVGDINMASERCCIGRGVAAALHKSGSRSYTYYFMKSIEEVFSRFEAEGTVFGSISKKDFHNIQCIMVPWNIVNIYEMFAMSLDKRITTNSEESRTLAELRDTLLPRLISGELRVKNAEHAI